MWEGLLEVWDDLSLRPEEVIDFGDRLLITAHVTGHARQSGIVLDMPLFQVLTLHRGLIVRQKDFGERDSAFATVALTE